MGDNKIGGFAYIKGRGKTTVISFEKGANKLFRVMICLVNSDFFLNKFYRVDHISNLINHLLLTIFLLNKIIELLFVSLWDDIPYFCTSKVIVVDRVDPRVLNVPAKGRKHHTNIHPRDVYATDVLTSLITYVE